MPAHATVDIEVRYAETDQMGVVHHSNYLVWFELARTRLCEGSGFHYAEVEQRGYFLTVTGAQLTYRRPAHYGDHLQVDCFIDRLGSRAVRFAYAVRRGEELIADGMTDHVWISVETRRPVRTPEFLKAGFEGLAG